MLNHQTRSAVLSREFPGTFGQNLPELTRRAVGVAATGDTRSLLFFQLCAVNEQAIANYDRQNLPVSTLPEFAGMNAAEIEEKANQLTREGIEGSIHHENERYAEQQGWKPRQDAPEGRVAFERLGVVK